MVLLIVMFSSCQTIPSPTVDTCYNVDGWYYGKTITGYAYSGPPKTAAVIIRYVNETFSRNTFFRIQKDLAEARAFTDGNDDLTLFIGPTDKCKSVHLNVAIHRRGADREELRKQFADFQMLIQITEDSLK